MIVNPVSVRVSSQTSIITWIVNPVSVRVSSQTSIDGFQMSIKRPTSGGQARAQEAAVQQIFHLERSSFFYL